ncbi:MAG: 50S ribosomal protein L3 [Candidatus Magasanikbacteria bacterium CG10_big_fil_rev_8_21_14_0_10_47_10]|uniref:Large ribosomal subunit protein uL3 n=1 Tax=Candidatus Magasanikbacteria bacterium CG10_big_fil_rev_8_21_14_0_10_47_10 TaxID=1974652 RepID=A0A2H0TPA7_9BACT|nr:MAG: 50S ribosomal protein L3 [Candidatus Magasanikbacteria bacterium CG10_big_fil_rev_8_21_14_0_10_47_10]
MKFILGTKLGMTQVFREDGTVVPVTRIQAGPCVVTQVKNSKKDAVPAVQIGFGEQKMFRVNKAQQGHLQNLPTVRVMRDISVTEDELGLKRGDSFTVSVFEPGEKVQVTGTSKGKGFQGVVKRHGFKGSKATHGNKDQLRMPGSIGAGGVQRVFKGLRMGGHMGDDQVTVKNLEVVEVHPENNELFVKGAVPGARGGLLVIATPEGKIEIAVEPAEHIEPANEAAVTSVETTPDINPSPDVEKQEEQKQEE